LSQEADVGAIERLVAAPVASLSTITEIETGGVPLIDQFV
jgi:hypothetical protein